VLLIEINQLFSLRSYFDLQVTSSSMPSTENCQ
jgi:hypothetical protein